MRPGDHLLMPQVYARHHADDVATMAVVDAIWLFRMVKSRACVVAATVQKAFVRPPRIVHSIFRLGPNLAFQLLEVAMAALDTSGWSYCDKQDLNSMLRRRKLIGRRSVDKVLWPDLVRSQLGMMVDEFAGNVAAALAWLCDASSRRTNTSWDLWDLRETQNGAIYLMPVEKGPWRMKRSDSHFDQTLTCEGAGICASMLAISWIGEARSRGPAVPCFAWISGFPGSSNACMHSWKCIRRASGSIGSWIECQRLLVQRRD